MMNEMNKEIAKNSWDDMILEQANANFYQSYSNSQICLNNDDINYFYDIERDFSIMAFVKELSNAVKIPFGPIVSDSVNIIQILDFINKISKYYNKDVIFSIDEKYFLQVPNYSNLKKDWYFETPLVDTSVSIEDIIKNCTKNRKRIIKKVLEQITENKLKHGEKYADEFFELYVKRLKETKGDLDLSFLEMHKILNEKNTRLTVCMNEEESKIIAGSISFMFGDTLITRYNCYDSEYSKLSPIAFVDYNLLKQASLNSKILYYDMSGFAAGDDIPEKLQNINRYKLSYGPQKILKYQWYKYEVRK